MVKVVAVFAAQFCVACCSYRRGQRRHAGVTFVQSGFEIARRYDSQL
jgi:hypothetical protein